MPVSNFDPESNSWLTMPYQANVL